MLLAIITDVLDITLSKLCVFSYLIITNTLWSGNIAIFTLQTRNQRIRKIHINYTASMCHS